MTWPRVEKEQHTSTSSTIVVKYFNSRYVMIIFSLKEWLALIKFGARSCIVQIDDLIRTKLKN